MKKNVGKNITVEVIGNIATITIDLSKRLGLSSSGKSTIVATTSGNITLPDSDVIVGINAYVK